MDKKHIDNTAEVGPRGKLVVLVFLLCIAVMMAKELWAVLHLGR